MNVWVDQEECISCGICIEACPGVFRFNDAGKAEAFDPGGGTTDEIQRAVDGCPVSCIHLTE